MLNRCNPIPDARKLHDFLPCPVALALGYLSPRPIPLQVPHHLMSPRVLPGMRTTGIIIGISQPSGFLTPTPAVAQPGGFELILWVANPTGYFWQRCTPVFLAYRDASVTFDINAFPLYFQIVPASVLTDGDILFSIMEV